MLIRVFRSEVFRRFTFCAKRNVYCVHMVGNCSTHQNKSKNENDVLILYACLKPNFYFSEFRFCSFCLLNGKTVSRLS